MKSGRLSLFGRLAACLVALLTTTCTDDTGPTVPIEGRFALAPSFTSSVAGIIEIREIRFTLARTDESMAKDTVIQLPPGADSVVLELRVPLVAAGEVFSLVVTLMDADGTVMFSGGPVDVVPGMPGSTLPIIPMTFDYTGPGANAADVAITTEVVAPGILTGDTLRVAAVAVDSGGEPIPGTPIAWRSLDSAHAVALADPTSTSYGALVIGRVQRGTAPVVAELLTGPADTTGVPVQPVPVAITLESGDGQSGSIGSELSSPLIARLVAADQQGVAGLWVYCTPSQGSMGADSMRTDTDGGLAMAWSLGSTAGQQSMTMTVARFPTVSASFTATALPGDVATLVVSPSSATLDALGAQVQLTATAADAGGNPIPDAQVTWASESDRVALVDDAGLVTAVSEGLIDIIATADTVTTLVPLTVDQVATNLAFTVEPSDVEAGAVITPPVEVSVLDRLGSVVADATNDVTITILDNPSGGTLSGPATVPAVAGIASFADLSIDVAGTYYRLEAGAPGLDIAESATFDVLPPGGRTVLWAAPVDGNWSDSTKWSTGAPPGPADTVQLLVGGTYTVTLDVDATVASLEVGPGSGLVRFENPGQVLTIDEMAVFGGTSVYAQGGGSLDGAGDVGVWNTFEWTGGTLAGSGTFRLEASAVGQLSGAADKTVAGPTFENLGTLTWLDGFFWINSGSVVNQAGAVFNLQQGSNDDLRGPGWLVNYGTVRSTTNGAAISVPFENAGLVEVIDGWLELSGGGTHSGTFTVAAGTTLLFSGGTQTVNGGITGPGILNVSGGTAILNGSAGPGTVVIQSDGSVTVTGPLSVSDSVRLTTGTLTVATGDTVSLPRLYLRGGTLTGTDPVAVTTAFGWSGGWLRGGDALVLGSGVTGALNGSDKRIDGRALHNQGTLTWTLGNLVIEGADFVNQPGAELLVQSDLNVLGPTNPGSIINDGTVRKTGGAGALSVPVAFVNTGLVDVQSGTVAFTAAFDHLGGALQGTGTLDVSAATVGSFTGDVNPGTSAGILTLVGDLPQQLGSTVNLELNGTTAGQLYDRLVVSGEATITGDLRITVGYTPTPGDSLTVLTYASRGAGAVNAVYGLELGGTLTLDTVWTPTELALVVRAPPPGSIVFAGDSAGLRGLFSVNPDGSALTRFYPLQSLNDERIHPRWSPDRTRVAYTWRPSGTGNANELRLIEPPVQDVVSLVFDTSAFRPRWSPNGIHLAFECGDGFSVFDVCVIPDVSAELGTLGGIGNGAGKAYVTAFDPVNRKSGPGAFAWDPLDAGRITFVRDSSDGVSPPSSRIYTARYDGQNLQPLSNDTMDVGTGPLLIVGAIDWSPDGQRLAFPAVDPTGAQELYVLERATGIVTQLTATANVWEDDPLWSPLGSELLFTRDLGCDYDAWLMDADGGNPRRVTDERVCDFSTDLLGYDWSPDGQEIVLTGFFAPYDGPLIYKIPRSATAETYFAERTLLGRYGSAGYEVRDIQPSWRW